MCSRPFECDIFILDSFVVDQNQNQPKTPKPNRQPKSLLCMYWTNQWEVPVNLAMLQHRYSLLEVSWSTPGYLNVTSILTAAFVVGQNQNQPKTPKPKLTSSKALAGLHVCDEPTGGSSQPSSVVAPLFVLEVSWCAPGYLNVTLILNSFVVGQNQNRRVQKHLFELYLHSIIL